jgi:hypothetical protein
MDDKQFPLRLPAELHKALKTRATKFNTSINAEIIIAIRRHLGGTHAAGMVYVAPVDNRSASEVSEGVKRP